MCKRDAEKGYLMEFKQLTLELKGLTLDAIRAENEDYFEAVILKSQLDTLISKLDKVFGLALWPSQAKLTDETKNVIEEFGGVMSGQTLYLLKQDKQVFFAMLWPWQDGKHITLKTGCKS